MIICQGRGEERTRTAEEIGEKRERERLIAEYKEESNRKGKSKHKQKGRVRRKI